MKATTPRNGAAVRAAAAGAEPIRVEDGVPYPDSPAPYTSARAMFPFATMKIGQSFETPKASVASAATKYMTRMAERGEDVYLRVRKQKNGLYRCWRKDPRERTKKTRRARNGARKTTTKAPAKAPAKTQAKATRTQPREGVSA